MLWSENKQLLKVCLLGVGASVLACLLGPWILQIHGVQAVVFSPWISWAVILVSTILYFMAPIVMILGVWRWAPWQSGIWSLFVRSLVAAVAGAIGWYVTNLAISHGFDFQWDFIVQILRNGGTYLVFYGAAVLVGILDWTFFRRQQKTKLTAHQA